MRISSIVSIQMFMLFNANSMKTLLYFLEVVNLQPRHRLESVFSVAVSSMLRVLKSKMFSEGTDTGFQNNLHIANYVEISEDNSHG